jgi:ATP-dependent RNA helicase DHX8/PRP22
MAQRVSYEMNTQLGREVGYTVRFEDKSSHNTQIRFVTDGILVRQCQSDPYLDMYDVIILDEAHERSLNTDILFALCKRAVRCRPGLKLVITSATLKTSQISEYYNNCPVLSVSGRCYPVNIMHKEAAKDKRVENCVGAAIRIHLNEPAGDILAFLTGFDECEKAVRDCFEKLQMLAEQGKDVPPMMLCALYGSQRSDE